MKNVRLINVFLASPGDVVQENQSVREILESINRTLGEEKGVQLKVVNWKTDSFPSYGGDAQALLNDQIADMGRYDLFIGIMWNRFGTATPRAGSGTEEELLRAVESFEKIGSPQIMFYFNQAPHSFKSAEEAEQKMKVLAFKKNLELKSLPYEYNDLDDFKHSFRNHIETWLVKQNPPKLEPPHPESEIGAVKKPKVQVSVNESISDSGMWILLKNGFFLASEVSETGQNKVQLKMPADSAEHDATFRSLQPTHFGRQEPIPFAHQNTGAIARVMEAKRMSTNGQNFWEMILVLDERNSGFLSEMTVNGVSADQIAELRARFILLNEKPFRTDKPTSRLNLNEGLIEAYVSGVNSPVKIEAGVLPVLWENVNKDVASFLPLARLMSVFNLISSNTCEYILELTMGPVVNEKVHIKFKGQRHRQYSNVEPYIISFEGDCELNSN